MNRTDAIQFCREELNSHELHDWSIRLSTADRFLGLCSYKDKCIFLNANHIELHPKPEVINTIRHEIAHALTPGHQHDEVWVEKAREIGCTNTAPCSHLSLSPELIDAIRSGADVEVTYVEEKIYKPTYKVTRLQDKCPTCGKVAKESRTVDVPVSDPTKSDKKIVFYECGHAVVKNIPKGTPFQTLTSNWWRDEIKDCKHEFTRNQCIHCGEYKPFPFQVEGMKFLEAALATNKGGAVFDEMGLGKTIQAVGLLKFKEEQTPVLILTKKKAKFQWFKEILRWCGPSYLPQVLTTSNDFIIPNLKCYIGSYDMFVFKTRTNKKTGKEIKQGFDITRFEGIVKTIVLDECQQIKNPDAARTREIRKLAKNCQIIGLSATPWKNRGSEFYTILNLLAPSKFPTYQGFVDKWVDFYFDGKFTKEGGINDVAKFKDYIKELAIRREVKDVAVEMPDVNRTLFYTELDKVAEKTYEDEVSEFVKWYNDKVIGGEEDDFSTQGNILAKLARMRHITGLAKIDATVELVEDIIEDTGEKVCVFVHHKDVGEILASEISKKFPDIPVYKFHAQMSDMDSMLIADKFNQTPLCIGILSTLAAGEAINLQTCRHAIMHERQWNPQNEDQAAPGRFRRIGATFNMVNVTFVTASGTVDEILAGIVERKRAAFHSTMNKGNMPTWNERAVVKELAEGIVNDWNKKNKKLTKMASLA